MVAHFIEVAFALSFRGNHRCSVVEHGKPLLGMPISPITKLVQAPAIPLDPACSDRRPRQCSSHLASLSVAFFQSGLKKKKHSTKKPVHCKNEN